MKRLKIFASILLALCLVSCGNKTSAPPKEISELSNSYYCVADISYKGIQARAGVTKAAPGMCRLDFTQPALLNGMSVSVENGKLLLSYKGFDVDLGSDSIPAKAITAIITDALENVSKESGVSFSIKDGAIIAEGKLDSGQYKLTLDAANGILVHLEQPESELNVDFSDFRYTASAQQ